nr:MarR family transcriptional regulator [uncultured Blautia sp.]
MNDELKNRERHIGYEVRTLDNMIGRCVNSWHSRMDEEAGITRMQAWIIGYMYEHSTQPVFQKDLEVNFQIARSTATGILQLMEKKDLIVRKPYPGDARLKRLELTARAEKYQREIMRNFDMLQVSLKKDIPQEKLDTFFRVVDMIKKNIEQEDFHDKNIVEPGKGI